MLNRTNIFLIPFLLLLVAEGSAQTTWKVSVDNSSIKGAISVASPGDTIQLEKGTYNEFNIEIDKPLSIQGEEGVVIDVKEQGFGFIVHADNVQIRDLQIRNTSRSFMEDYAGVVVEQSSNTLIEGLRLKDNFFGIYLAESDSAVVRNNHLTASGERETSSGNGIHAWYSTNARIENNRVEGHRDGLYFEFVKDAVIRNNLSENNIRYGIHFMYSDDCGYFDNTFRDNGGGVAVMYTTNVEIIGNRFEDNRGSSAYGLLLKEINRSRIEDNVFRNNSTGLYIEATSRNTVKHNHFESNGWAVMLMANSTDNQFTSNNFITNTFELATNSRQNFNSFSGNYWSDYEGYDLDRDGFGDVPHRPVRLFSVIVERQPQSVLLLRSLLIDLLDMAERVMPVLTPESLIDEKPSMEAIQ